MSKEFFNENDTPWDIFEKIILSIMDNGFESTQRKILDEIKEAYNNPIKIDVEKMMKEVINEINEKGKKERENLHGEGHEYIIHRNLNNGVQKWIEVTEKNKEEIQKIWDSIKQNTLGEGAGQA